MKTRPRADCVSDHLLLITKFRLKLKKVGKTSRPVRCNLDQIPNKYTLEMINRFRGLDLVNRVPEELWTEIYNIYCTGCSEQNQPKEKKRRQSGCLRRLYK